MFYFVAPHAIYRLIQIKPFLKRELSWAFIQKHIQTLIPSTYALKCFFVVDPFICYWPSIT